MSTNFITIDELKLNSAISKNVDPSLLEPFISISETIHVEPILGLALTTEIKTQIDNLNLSANNQKLLDNYIIPCSSWGTYYESSPFLMYRTNNKGITKNFSDVSQPIEKDEFILLRESINDKFQFFRNQLIAYLEDNRTLYPLYRSDGTCSNIPRRGDSTGIYLG